MPVNKQFMTYLNSFLDNIGIKDENILRQVFEQTQNINRLESMTSESVKSMLLQLVKEDTSTVRNQAQPLIHLMNGMQLQGVIQSDNTLQATLQLPGGKLALHDDIFLQFEGQKSADGKINPEYCRIMFVLHLHHLEETMIDMQIQKRVISLQVFNDKMKDTSIEDNAIRAILKEK